MIYMDHAATTSMHPEVLRAMEPYFCERFANPSGTYRIATENRETIQACRQMIADTLQAGRDTVYFTSGGTESDNWALVGIAEAYRDKGRHIITTAIEHHGLLHTAEYLEKRGYRVTYLEPDEQGRIDPDRLERAIEDDTILISVMFANNEIGTIQPIGEIGRMAHRHGVLFHTDAVQAYGQIPIDVDQLEIDLLSASGHKFRGPKGCGFLYVREGVEIGRFLHGGAQERGMRAGTENVPGIIGLSKAAELADASMDRNIRWEQKLRDRILASVEAQIPDCRLNGDRTNRLPNNVNVSFAYVDGSALLVLLNEHGICASGGSACTSASKTPSHVLMAIGLPESLARGTVRLTVGSENTEKEADETVACLRSCVEELRRLSPECEDREQAAVAGRASARSQRM